MTKFREDGTRWKGGQLSYFLHVTQPSEEREDLYCLTLAQTEALIAVIEQWRYLTRWLDDDPDNALSARAVRQFVDDTQRRLMMPCGSDNIIVLSQWTPDGHYQESTDGGTTYHDAPGKDPRNNVPLPPPFLPPGTVDANCTYADSIVNKLINDWINATGATEDQATVIEGIISFLAGLFGAFGVVAAAITLGIAIVIVAFSIAAWKAAFVSDVWNRLRCNIAAHIGTDGTFTQMDVDAIYAQIATDETGIVKISLQGMIAAMGWQGLTIAARAGAGSPTADCDCSDICDLDLWEEWTTLGPLGTIISVGPDYVEMQSQSAGAFGAQAAGMVFPDGCCFYDHPVAVGMNAGAGSYYSACGHDPDDTGGNINTPFAVPVGTEINMITLYGGTAVFTVKFYFAPPP